MKNLTCIDFNPSAKHKAAAAVQITFTGFNCEMRPSGGTGTRHYQCVHWPDQRRIYYLPSLWIMLQIGLKVKLATHALYSTSHRWFRARPDILAVIFCILQSWKTLWSSLTYLWSISRRLFPGSTQGHTDDFLVTFLRILMTVWNPDNASGILLFVSVLLLLFKFVFLFQIQTETKLIMP